MGMKRMQFEGWLVVGLCLMLQACGSTPRTSSVAHLSQATADSEWQGRLSVQVHGEPPTSMSAGFLLRGNAQNGELDLYAPLGNTLGELQWSPQSARLNQGGTRQYFASMAELTAKITGTALPMDAIFLWLQGVNAPAAGWQADLSGASQGLVTARRTLPLPEVNLRIKLD